MKEQDKQAGIRAVARIAGGTWETFAGTWDLGIVAAKYPDMKQEAIATALGTSQSTISRSLTLAKAFRSFEQAEKAFLSSGKESVVGFLATLGGKKAEAEPKPMSSKAACVKASKAPYFSALPENIRAAILAQIAL